MLKFNLKLNLVLVLLLAQLYLIQAYSINTNTNNIVYSGKKTIPIGNNKKLFTKEKIEIIKSYYQDTNKNETDTSIKYAMSNNVDASSEKIVRKTLSSDTYYKKQLSSAEKKVYNAFAKVVDKEVITTLNFTIEMFESKKCNYEDIDQLLTRSAAAFLRDNFSGWWIENFERDFHYNNSTGYITDISILLDSSRSISEINKLKKQVKDVAVSVAVAAKKEKTVYNQLKYVYEYLIKNIVKYMDNDFINDNYNIYGALIMDQALCEGYAESFAYIARMMGYNVITVNSVSHEWNFVKLGSKWYALDATWDDITVEEEPYYNTNYHYFLIGSESEGCKKYGEYVLYKECTSRQLDDCMIFSISCGFKFPKLTKKAYASEKNN